MKETNEKLLKPGQVSYILNISELTVKKLAKDGDLPCIYINRQPRFNYDKLVEHFKEIERSVA